MTTLPLTEVLIQGKTYAVVPMPPEDAGKLDGLNCLKTQTIFLDVDSHPDNLQEILLHEVLHGISDQLRLRMSERQVTYAALGILEVLKTNPKLSAFLLSNAAEHAAG